MPVVIITGANRGLGLEFARRYAKDNWQVITINRRSSPELDALAAEHAVRIIEADLTSDASLVQAVDAIDVDAVDLLLNNAGMMGDGSFADVGLDYQKFGTFNRDEWHRVYDINVCTPMALTELLVDKLQAAKRPVVVTVSSMLGSNKLNNFGNSYAYRASKSAVNSIMRSMGINLRERGITAIALHPGWVRTELGGDTADLSVEESVDACIRTIAGLELRDGGRFVAYSGEDMPY